MDLKKISSIEKKDSLIYQYLFSVFQIFESIPKTMEFRCSNMFILASRRHVNAPVHNENKTTNGFPCRCQKRRNSRTAYDSDEVFT